MLLPGGASFPNDYWKVLHFVCRATFHPKYIFGKMIIIIIALVSTPPPPIRHNYDGNRNDCLVFFRRQCVLIIRAKQCQSNIQMEVSFKIALPRESKKCESKMSILVRLMRARATLRRVEMRIDCLHSWMPMCCCFYSMDWVNKKVILLWMKWKYSFCLSMPILVDTRTQQIYSSRHPQQLRGRRQKKECLFSIGFGTQAKNRF